MAKVAVLVGQEFEDSELRLPVERLREAGHDVELVGSEAGEVVRGKKGRVEMEIDRAIAGGDGRERLDPEQYDALVIPGGKSPSHLREDEDVVGFVRDFMSSGKVVAAVCHGPQLLVEAGAAGGRLMTSWPAVRDEIENAGGRWVDREVVEEGSLITSRKPEDLEAFSEAILRRLELEPGREATARGARGP